MIRFFLKKLIQNSQKIRNYFSFLFYFLIFFFSYPFSHSLIASDDLENSKTSYDTFPIPDALIGYRPWKQNYSHFKINPKIIDNKNNIVEIQLQSEAAEEVKISRNPNFKNSTWRPYQPTMKWSLNPQENKNFFPNIRTLFVVFKHYDQVEKQYQISPIFHDSIDLKNPEKKIVRTPNGIMDWSKPELLIALHIQQTPQSNKKYRLINLQNKAEQQGNNLGVQTLLKLPLLQGLSIEDHLLFHPSKKEKLKHYIFHQKLVEIFYPSLNEIVIQKGILFYQKEIKNQQLSLYRLLNSDLTKPTLTPPVFSLTKTDLSPRTVTPVSTLIIDTRGLKIKPTLFTKLANQKGEIFFNAFYFNSSKIPFVRYYRSLPDRDFLSDSLMTTAYDFDNRKGAIKLLDKFVKKIISDPKNLERIALGNLYILID